MPDLIYRSKRWRATIGFLMLNFITFWVAMFNGINLTEVGVGLAALNVPLYGYLWAESTKPSKPENKKGNE